MSLKKYFKSLPITLQVMWVVAILFIFSTTFFITYGIIDFRKYMKEHDEWVKTIQAPSDGRLMLDREKPFCKIDSIMGDSVKITTIVHRKNIWKNE